MKALSAAALAGPATLVAVLFAISGGMALVSGQPLIWRAQTMTLTEAIGMHDTAEIVRQIALGADPSGRYDTWDVLKRDLHVTVTPLEAAVATREKYLFDLVEAHGANLTPEIAQTLQCFAMQEHATEIAESLAKRFDAPVSCAGVKLPW